MLIASAMDNLGTESAFQVSTRVAELQRQGKDVINLGIGQPDFKTAPHIVEAAVKALQGGHHGYTDPKGILPLREVVAAFNHQRYGVSLDVNRLLVVPGGKVTMFLAAMMLGGKGHEIIYPNPGFPIYESVIKFSGAKAVPLPLLEKNQFAFDADDVLARITPQTSLIMLNSPSNPTGGVTPKSEYDKLVKGLEQHPHVVVMADEIYSAQLYDGEQHCSLTQYDAIRDRLILLEGWSKTWAMTGWRLGYSYWPEKLIEKAAQLCINIHSCVNAAAQFAAIAAMQGSQDHVADMLKDFDERRHYVVERCNQIDGLSCVTPKGAFYAFPNITNIGKSSHEWQQLFLEKAHVGLIAGTSFGAYGEGYMRLSYAASLDAIKEALDRVERLIQHESSA